MKHKKGALLHSIIAILLCISLLAGTTFAWFTDSVSTEGNIIQSGRLKVGMFWTGDLEPESGEVSWTDASEGPIFNYDHWEPGYTDLKYLKLENQGNLAFQYQLTFGLPESADPATADIPGTPAGDAMALAEVIDVYYAPVTQKLASREEALEKLQRVGTLADMIQGRTYTGEGVLLPEGAEAEENVPAGSTVACVMLKMQESAGNEYRGKVAGDGFCLKVLATQYTYEYDSYGKDYDADAAAATFPSYPGIEEDPEGEGNEGSEPEGSEPEGSEPEGGNGGNPEGGNPEGGNPEGGNPEGGNPEGGNPEGGNPEGGNPEGGNPEGGNPEGGNPEGGNPEGGNPEGGNPEGGNPEGGDPEGDDPEGDDPEGGNGGNTEGGSQGTTTTEQITLDGATLPAGVKLDQAVEDLELIILEKGASDANVVLGENDALLSLDVHIDGVSPDNNVPILIDLGLVLAEGMNKGNVSLYHVEDGETHAMTRVYDLADLDEHNEYYYDIETGNTTVAMATFSEVALVSDITKAWEGNFDYSWYTNAVAPLDGEATADYIIANADQLAAFGAIVGGMDGQTRDSFSGQTVKLIADINLGDKESANNPDLIFYPIGYYNNQDRYTRVSGGSVTSDVYAFKGTFDGQGHTISNFYQNTWEMFGDYNSGYTGTPNYYKDAMGLFGYVDGGTVKNLTVDNFSSDGEFTPTGVIAAYADGDSKFENIAITNCNPRVYNTGNGGIIGIAGDTSAADDDHITLENITVDNSNKISALWGSYDVACGGLVGMYRGNVDGSGNATGDTISFKNCHVSAIMDVYNDVCANYQYYAYRYAGMIIGSVRHNTKNADGKTIPNMAGIYATGCTVNYGDWNDYYYCEFEKNTQASYTEDFQFSRVPHSELNFGDANGNGVVDADERASVSGCKHTHTANEDKQAVYLPFHQLFTGYSWGVSSIGLEEYSGIVTDLGITEGDQEGSVVKFNSAFPKATVNAETGVVTTDFLYRVGNGNTVNVGSLFVVLDDYDEGSGHQLEVKKTSNVHVTIDKVDENSNVSGNFTANTTDWTKGTIQFSGTGVVKVTIQDYNFCKPTELMLEVVDAVNATGATSATANNVVLLNDCGFSSLEVSGGYTLYGNGFTMTCGSDSAALDMGYSFVTLNNGTLDNVQIVCPNFDYAALYKSNLTSSDNRSETTDKTRYYNAKSGVMASGNSQILNSRISGGRAAVNVSGGNVVIDNSRIELGAVASVLVGAANNLTLRDVTLVQKPTASTYDSNKKLMGFSVLYMCDSEGKATSTTLEGSFVQQAWVNADDKQYVPSAGQDIVDGVMKETAFIHNINGKDSLNLGFAYMPEDAQKTVAAPDNITDNRTDKATIPYEMKDVKIQISILSTTVYVYSYKNTNGTADSFKTESNYVPNKQNDIITVAYSDTADGLTTGKSFSTDGWVYELNVDLDKLSGYALDFSKLSMSVNGVAVTDFKVDGNAKPTSPVAVVAGGTTYTLTAAIGDKEYTAIYKVTGTETSKESPSLVASNYEAGLCVASSYGGTWHGAAPALQGIQIKYWSVAEKQYKTINLSDYTPTTKGQLNGTNTTWTYSPANGDFTLTLTGGQVHSSNNVYAMPVVCDGKLYFVAAKSNGLVNSGNSARTIPVSYTFKDNNNGDVLTFSHTWSVAENKDAQYKYSDFCNGTLTKLEAGSGGGGTCLAEGTMMTMADGSKRAIEDLRKGDLIMSFDHLTGKITAREVIIVVRTSSEFYKNTFVFDDGTKLVTINEHGIYDLNINKYVNIDHENAEEFIGHDFVSVDSKGKVGTKKLVCVDSEFTSGYKYDIVTEQTLNYVAEDTLSVTHVLVDIINSFDFDSKMCYDRKKMQTDITKYGLYTYDEWEEYCEIAVFEQYNIPVMKVGVSKELYTKDYIIYLINTYVLDKSVQIID